MARVLLVNPPIYDFAAFDLWARPLGLLYLAAFLEKLGHEVRLVDCLDRRPYRDLPGMKGAITPHPKRYGTGHYLWQEADKPAAFKDIPRIYKRFGVPPEVFTRQLAAGFAPDIIGVTSGMTYWYPGVIEAVQACREVFPGIPVALGGIYATLCGDHARETVRPDFLVEGPGEIEMARIVGEACSGPAPPETVAFADLPKPAYHLLGNVQSVSILTGRGCPFDCAFCAVHRLSQRLERRSPESVVHEIEGYAASGVSDIAFFDDALLWRSDKHIKPILAEVVRRGPPLRLHTPNGLHARFVDAEIADLMHRVGFKTIRISLETVAPARLASWDEKVHYDEYLRAAGLFRKAGFTPDELGAYVMLGLPDETLDEAARNIAAAHVGGARVKIAEYSPVPRTAYFESARQASRFDLDEPLCHNNTLFATGGLEYEVYERLKRFARALNGELDRGRIVFTPAQVESPDTDFAALVEA